MQGAPRLNLHQRDLKRVHLKATPPSPHDEVARLKSATARMHSARAVCAQMGGERERERGYCGSKGVAWPVCRHERVGGSSEAACEQAGAGG